LIKSNSSKQTTRIALGTVQFGIPYGIANKTGQVKQRTVKSILNLAQLSGIDTLDTAIDYGDSEKCLGQLGTIGWRVVSKLPSCPTNEYRRISKWTRNQVQGSLERLKSKSLYGLLVHQPEDLNKAGGNDIWSTLLSLKEEGVIEKIGFSIYEPIELERLLNSFQPDLIQAPYSIFDQSLVTTGWLNRLINKDIEVHIRSVFLQGLLLMEPTTRPEKFNRWSDLWDFWDKWLLDNKISALEACVSFSMAETKISRVIVGVENITQLEEILLASEAKIAEFPKELNTIDPNLINPSNWNLL
jgi:aryl-alcohol dehydrogenase-like predicted oxidoreductase